MPVKTIVDEHAATELYVATISNGNFYHYVVMPALVNLSKKGKRGTYNNAKALKLWEIVATKAAKAYTLEYDTKGAKYHEVFNATTRRAVAINLQTYYDEQLRCLVTGA